MIRRTPHVAALAAASVLGFLGLGCSDDASEPAVTADVPGDDGDGGIAPSLPVGTGPLDTPAPNPDAGGGGAPSSG